MSKIKKLQVICSNLKIRKDPSNKNLPLGNYYFGNEIISSEYKFIDGEDGRKWIGYLEGENFRYLCFQDIDNDQYLKIIEINNQDKITTNILAYNLSNDKFCIKKPDQFILKKNKINNSICSEFDCHSGEIQPEPSVTYLEKDNYSQNYEIFFKEIFYSFKIMGTNLIEKENNTNQNEKENKTKQFCIKKREIKPRKFNIKRSIETIILSMIIQKINSEIGKNTDPELNNKKLFKIGKERGEFAKRINILPLNKTFKSFIGVEIKKNCLDKNNNINLIAIIESKKEIKFQEINELLGLEYEDFWKYFKIYLRNINDFSKMKNNDFWYHLKDEINSNKNIKLDNEIEYRLNKNTIINSLMEEFINKISNNLNNEDEKEGYKSAFIEFFKKI